jgi:DnaJ family protein C protein 7
MGGHIDPDIIFSMMNGQAGNFGGGGGGFRGGGFHFPNGGRPHPRGAGGFSSSDFHFG